MSNLSKIVHIMHDICSIGYTNIVKVEENEINNLYMFGNIFLVNIANYISEMTDSYAVHEFEKLYLQK